jgi:hypothetical protein
MPKAPMAQEVAILNFFEEAPVDKAEMLFNIVKDKMRARRTSKEPVMKKKNETRLSGSKDAPQNDTTTA